MTKIYKYAILWLHSQNMSAEDINKEIGALSLKQIIGVINKHTKNQTVQTDPATNISKKSTVQDLIITESVGQKHRVAIMTKSASEVADSDRSKNTPSNQDKPYIFKPSK